MAPVAYRTTTHSTALSFVFFIKAASVVIKMQHSGPQLLSVVNLQDCFTAQRRRASQQRTGRSAHVVLQVNLEAERRNTPEADCVFACVLVANDSSRLSERRLNRERKQSSHFESELCAWYHTCDQLEEPSCCFCHPSEAAPYVWMCHSHDESPRSSFVLITRVVVWYIGIRFLFSCSFITVSKQSGNKKEVLTKTIIAGKCRTRAETSNLWKYKYKKNIQLCQFNTARTQAVQNSSSAIMHWSNFHPVS